MQRAGFPDSVIAEIQSWESLEMVKDIRIFRQKSVWLSSLMEKTRSKYGKQGFVIRYSIKMA